ncbi:outer dense fiber protein 3-like [Teleopsis dalmanni]|uniref:outer dense fiber protein 3-like n=1 Tax=Teleopsis dalmanni TaxID=139649 RepID=UPI0018CFA7BF|nr:outer dense fiber protein 3-like [Teleopsis dalmanni]
MVYIEYGHRNDFICRTQKLILQRPWTPTVRKKKIIAEESLPKLVNLGSLIGRNILQYSLKRTAPAYRITGRIEKKIKSSTPSPAAYDISGLTCRGKFTCVTPTLKGLRECKQKLETPGPERYKSSKAYKNAHKNLPMYSFGYKRKIVRNEIIPGPNVFALPSMVGPNVVGKARCAPAYSLTGRIDPNSKFLTPCPTTYTPVIDCSKKNLPKYSLRGHCHQINSQKQIPGPAAYCPQSYNRYKSAPEISFAIKHSPYSGRPLPKCLDPVTGICKCV